MKEDIVSTLKEQKGEGCNVHGTIRVHRVAGNYMVFSATKKKGQINIVVGRFAIQNSYFVIDTKPYEIDGNIAFNMSHTINSLSFGKPYPGMRNPLDGVSKIWEERHESIMYDYYAKVEQFYTGSY
jgi:hypothetical protein